MSDITKGLSTKLSIQHNSFNIHVKFLRAYSARFIFRFIRFNDATTNDKIINILYGAL